MTGSLKEAKLQESVRTNRNCIRGTAVWVSNHIFTKPAANKHCCVDAAGIDFKDKCLTRGDLDEIMSRSQQKPWGGDHRSGEGLNINRSELRRDEQDIWQ